MSFCFLIFFIYIFSQKISIRSEKTKRSKLSDKILMTSESENSERERAEEKTPEETEKLANQILHLNS